LTVKLGITGRRTMRRKVVSIFSTAVAVLLLGSVFAASASAGPSWRFEFSELVGSESIAGSAVKSTLTFPGLTTTCDFSYGMKISNSAGSATGKVNEMTLSNCATNSKWCTLESSVAEKLPWPVHGVTVAGANYVIFEGIKFTLLYAGEECALGGIAATFTGTAGGLYDNNTGTFVFNSASFSATKTAIKALKTTIEWNAVFTTEALGAHKGEILELR
jgi:hypothetical protein